MNIHQKMVDIMVGAVILTIDNGFDKPELFTGPDKASVQTEVLEILRERHKETIDKVNPADFDGDFNFDDVHDVAIACGYDVEIIENTTLIMYNGITYMPLPG